MKTIIGLLESEAAIDTSILHLKQAGINEKRISLLSTPKAIHQLLGCDPVCVVKNYTFYGAAIGVAIYAIFGLLAAACQCNLLQYGQEYGIGTFLGSVLAGIFVGGFLGLLVGAGEAEKDSHLYVHGILAGEKMISVEVEEEGFQQILQLLSAENILGLKVIQA